MEIASLLKKVTALIIVAGMVACSAPPPYKIGFLSSFSGGLNELSIATRNGIILAIEQTNRAGGLSGRLVDLVLRDDGRSQETVLRSMKHFSKQNVRAVIGPLSTEMSRVAMSGEGNKKMVMISPTANSVDFNPPGGLFFRIAQSDFEDARSVAELAYNKRGYRRVSILYDLTNRAYAQGRVFHFRRVFEKFGGTIEQVTTYTTRADTDFGLLASQVSQNDPDAIYIITTPKDLAQLCIELRLQNQTTPVLTDGLGVNTSLLKQGGMAVDGLEFFQPFDFNSTAERFLVFLRDYEKRFHEQPEIASFYGYEAARILLTGLDHAQNRRKLSQTIRDLGVFKGLQYQLRIDSDGTVVRPMLHRTIKDGRIVTLREG